MIGIKEDDLIIKGSKKALRKQGSLWLFWQNNFLYNYALLVNYYYGYIESNYQVITKLTKNTMLKQLHMNYSLFTLKYANIKNY